MNAFIKIALCSIALLAPCSIFSSQKKEESLTAQNMRKVDQWLNLAISQSGEALANSLRQAEEAGKDVFNLVDRQIERLYRSGFDKSINIREWITAKKQQIERLRTEKKPIRSPEEELRRQAVRAGLRGDDVENYVRRKQRQELASQATEDEEKKRAAAQAPRRSKKDIAPSKFDEVVQRKDEEIQRLEDEIMALRLQQQEYQGEGSAQPARQPKRQGNVRILSQPTDVRRITQGSEQ